MVSNIIISLILFSFPFTVLSQGVPIIRFQRLDLPTTSRGPKAVTFNYRGAPFTGIADGRVLEYNGNGFLVRFITSETWNIRCEGTNDLERLGYICGRPTSLGFYKDNKLYIGDAYRGLLVVRIGNILALPVISSNTTLTRVTALDVDQLTGDVYYTIGSTRFNLSQIPLAVAANDATGSLVKYDPRNNRVTSLLQNLGGPGGVALSSDRSYVVVTEFIAKRLTKYFLTGPRAFTSQVLLNFTGRPEGIKRTVAGDFWVAVNEMSSTGIIIPTAKRVNGNGNVLNTVDLSRFYYNQTISEFQQRGLSTFFIGSQDSEFLGRIN